jgi:hypothetical protein
VRTAGRLLVLGWLAVALLVLGLDGRLGAYLLWTGLASLVVLVLAAVVRQQRVMPRYNRPSLPERYRVADDLSRPLVEVVAVAEAEADHPTLSCSGLRKW